MKKRKVFVDMDGVVADFDSGRVVSKLPSEQFKLQKHSYRHLAEIPLGLESLDWLESKGLDVFMATKIPTHNPYAATDKLLWLQERRPELLKKTIITPHKGLLGGKHDFLIDDRPHKAHCEEFEGTLLTFGPQNEFADWLAIRAYFEELLVLGPA